MNGLTFGMEGPNLEGNWYDPRTGDAITVVDTFFEDNQLIVKTSTGRILRYEQMQHYVKSEKPIAKIPQAPQHNILEEMSKDVSMQPELTNPVLGNLHKQPEKEVQTEVSDNYIIDKALKKYEMPKIRAKVNWGGSFPKDQIKSLMEMMDIELDDIIAWYISGLTVDQLMEDISNGIEDYIKEQLKEEKAPVKETASKSKKKA